MSALVLTSLQAQELEMTRIMPGPRSPDWGTLRALRSLADAGLLRHVAPDQWHITEAGYFWLEQWA